VALSVLKVMGNRKISNDLKECALNLWDCGWDFEDITDALLVSRTSLYRWRSISEEYGSVNRPSFALRGRIRTLTRAVLAAVHTLYTTDPDLYLDELVLWLAVHHDINISVSSLHENLTKGWSYPKDSLQNCTRERRRIAAAMERNASQR
jgi:hypothetical protein